ncbi:MAG: 16S rRNA (adenine(1518)-N(6)/adenine(1519)-N(6))-dimethyltransferase RsmA [Chloroflexota bacterium]|nr:16S rRNA (adenine(1518)-N(6)/adenine(1519)-N(6))-dimethyltransferase RsmA [Chloroflexota bacterium]
MTTPSTRLGDLLRRHGLKPRKGLGQNFLADPVHLDRIVEAAELSSDDLVLEVGPGVGTLTVRLAARAGHVVAIELDQKLFPALEEVLSQSPNVTVIHGDILQLTPTQLTIDHRQFTIDDYKVVANLPYYITSAAIRHLLTTDRPPTLLVLTVQREVAQRIVAQPPDMSLLAISVQFYAKPEIVARIPAGAFYPAPKVDSTILRLRVGMNPAVQVASEDDFFRVVRAGFSQRRKQLRNALKGGLGLTPLQATALLEAAEVAPQRRAETLSLGEWAKLANNWHYSSASGKA